MKVIIAGFSKTGTKSMVAALLDLNYKVYDFLDHYWYHGDEWSEIFTTGGSIELFQKMYKDVDAIADLPTFTFWEEISRAFPDCKIILTTRDEDKWFESFKAQWKELQENRVFQAAQIFSPMGWNFFKYNQKMGAIVHGYLYLHPFRFLDVNEMQMRRVYRQHQNYCLQNAPKDRLLVYHVSQGWEPLCNFLGEKIPNKPFPHENRGATIIAKLMRTHPSMLRIQREMMITLSLLLGLGAIGAYRFFKRGGGSNMTTLPSRLKNLFDVYMFNLAT